MTPGIEPGTTGASPEVNTNYTTVSGYHQMFSITFHTASYRAGKSSPMSKDGALLFNSSNLLYSFSRSLKS
eukprot:scaffold250380_cov63-Attheya_sp.AAC.1